MIALTPRETLRAVERCYPIARDGALGVVLRDGLGIAERLVELARRCKYPGPAETLWMLWFCLLAWRSF